jgi:peptide/nickel transport system ATP-binding protein
VLDQVGATGTRLRGLPRDRAQAEAVALLDELGITEQQALRHPAGLSGGQLQRAAPARALLARPRVLPTELPSSTAARSSKSGHHPNCLPPRYT